MEMLMWLWRREFELGGINSGSWYHCLPNGYMIVNVQQLCAM